MMRRWGVAAMACAALLLAATGARAHPHVWVTMTSELVYAPDGSLTGVRHAWTFDDMFSAFATQGLDSKVKGQFTREELDPLAKVNIESLGEFAYFTYAKANGKKASFVAPKDYYLDFANSVLTLHFLLPLKTPAKAQNIDIDVFDPTIFVDFSFDEKKDPVTLVGAPAQCKLSITRPAGMSAAQPPSGESFFSNLDGSSNYGAQFANKIAVHCP